MSMFYVYDNGDDPGLISSCSSTLPTPASPPDEPSDGLSSPESDTDSVFSTNGGSDSSYFAPRPAAAERSLSPSRVHHQDHTPITLPADHHIHAGFASLLFPPKLHVSDCQYRSFHAFIGRLGSSAISAAEAEYARIDTSVQRQFMDALPVAIRDGMWRDVEDWTHNNAIHVNLRFTSDHDATKLREDGVQGWKCGMVRAWATRRDGTQYRIIRQWTKGELERRTKSLDRREWQIGLRENKGMNVPEFGPAGNGPRVDKIGVKFAAIARVLRKWEIKAGNSMIFDKKWQFTLRPTWFAQMPLPSRLPAVVDLGKDQGYVGIEFVDLRDLTWIVRKAMDLLVADGFTVIPTPTFRSRLYHRRKLNSVESMRTVPDLPMLCITKDINSVSIERFDGIATHDEGYPRQRRETRARGYKYYRHYVDPCVGHADGPDNFSPRPGADKPISYAAAVASFPTRYKHTDRINAPPPSPTQGPVDLFQMAQPRSVPEAMQRPVKLATRMKRYAPVMPLVLRPPQKKVRFAEPVVESISDPAPLSPRSSAQIKMQDAVNRYMEMREQRDEDVDMIAGEPEEGYKAHGDASRFIGDDF